MSETEILPRTLLIQRVATTARLLRDNGLTLIFGSNMLEDRSAYSNVTSMKSRCVKLVKMILIGHTLHFGAPRQNFI